MNQALYQINKLKDVFQHLYPKNKNDKGYFNFLKFHAITYYPEFIHRYKLVDDVDSSYIKVLY